MDVIYGLIPTMIFIGIVLVIVLFWAIKSGQFDDFEGEAHRILMDEELVPQKPVSEKGKIEEKMPDDKSPRPINLPAVVLQTSSPANKTVGKFMFDESSEEKNIKNNEKKQDKLINRG